jgi:hypothetical protein
MPSGLYTVTGKPETREIEFDLVAEAPDPVPVDQVKLVEQVQKTLTVLQMLFDPVADKERFLEYFRPLVEIARNGVEGQNAKPDVAMGALVNLQDQTTTREAGRVKHRYMKRLAVYAGSNSAVWLFVGIIFLLASKIAPVFSLPKIIDEYTVACFFLLLSGCSAGVWLSFGARRPTLTFFELHIPEPDQLHPAMRVAFVMALTVIIGLLANLEVLSIGVGSISSAMVFSKPDVAWLIGALCGFSEQLLSTQVSEQAAKFFPGKAKSG